MDDYTFSYLEQDRRQADAIAEAESTSASVLLQPQLRPPEAEVRKRALTIPVAPHRTLSKGDDSLDQIKDHKPAWFEIEEEDELDNELLKARDVYAAQLAACKKLLSQADRVLHTIENIQAGFRTVSEQTSGLQDACAQLQHDEVKLTALANDVRSKLIPFSYLEDITRQLNVPGSGLVLQASYQEVLLKLDEALDFLAANPEYLDADVYQRQYRQSMTKALTLAEVYFIQSIKDVSADVTSRIQKNALNKNTQSALLYTKFRSVAPRIRPLIDNIEKARQKHNEYWSLLNDCWQAYFTTRRALLTPMIQSNFKDFATIADIASFSTSAISFMRILAVDESELFQAFFRDGKAEFTSYLTGFGQYFTDSLRSRIAAETSLSTLCEICVSMQSQCHGYSDEQDVVIFDMTPILSVTLGEIESRIMLRAQGVVLHEVQGYKPVDKDLDYPACLKHKPGGRSSVRGLGLRDEDQESLISTVVHEQWYTTLRVSISLLSKIYRLVQSSIFDELAHEVVRSCIASLLYAGNLVNRRSTIDGHLFLLRHLLILKDQLAAFDIEHNPKQPRSSLQNVSDAFVDLQARGEIFNPASLYNLASSGLAKLASSGYLTRNVENMQDARDEIEDQLRAVVGALTLYCAEQCTVSLRSAMGNKLIEVAPLVEANRKFRAGIPDSFALFTDSIELYIEDARVVSLLLGIIQDETLSTYERFNAYIRGCKHEGIVPDVRETVEWMNDMTQLEDIEEEGNVSE